MRFWLALLLCGLTSFAQAQKGPSGSGAVRVRGYTTKNGTYVAPHVRSRPDGNFSNNWSTKGNVNPYTGEWGTKTSPSGGSGSGSSGIHAYSGGSYRPTHETDYPIVGGYDDSHLVPNLPTPTDMGAENGVATGFLAPTEIPFANGTLIINPYYKKRPANPVPKPSPKAPLTK